MSKNTIITLIVIGLVIVIGGAWFFMNQQNSQLATKSQTNTNNTGTTSNFTPTPPVESNPDTSSSTDSASTTGKVVEFVVNGSNFKYEPNTLTVKKGDTVKITFKNLSGMHDFVIEEYDIDTPTIQSGQDQTIEFVADRTGSFEYYCSVGNHRDMGMTGTLTVN